MTDLPARLADVAARHAAAVREIDRPVHDRGDRRVLLPADRQRGPVPPRIGQSATSGRSCST